MTEPFKDISRGFFFPTVFFLFALGVVKECLSCFFVFFVFFASVTLGQIKSPKLWCQICTFLNVPFGMMLKSSARPTLLFRQILTSGDLRCVLLLSRILTTKKVEISLRGGSTAVSELEGLLKMLHLHLRWWVYWTIGEKHMDHC